MRQGTRKHIKVSIFLAADGSHFLEKWKLNNSSNVCHLLPRDNTFFFLKVKVLNFMCLENSFPKKINAKFCSLNIISKVNRVILVLLDYDLVFLLYCTLSYTMSTTETKTATRSNDVLPTSPAHVCMWGRKRNVSFQAGIY